MNAPKPTREERLAAKLRENLHRRKAQARALDEAETSAPCQKSLAQKALAQQALAKQPPER